MGTLGEPVIKNLILSLGALAIVFWIGLTYWVNRDARRRINSRFLVVVATTLGLVPYVGPVVYLLFRPAETKDDVRARDAEMAALETHAARRQETCRECSARIEATYVVCPVCTTRLRAPCAHCDAPLERLWQMCPYCATPVETELDLDEALTRQVRAEPALDLVPDAAAQLADA